MHTPVQDHAAALPGGVAPVARHAPGTVHAGLDVERPSQRVFPEQLFHDQKVLVPAPILVDGEDLARIAGRVDHPLKLAARQRDRLFAHHMLARVHRSNGNVHVQVVGQREGHKLDGRVVQKLIQRSVCLQPMRIRRRRTFGLDVVDARDFKFRQRTQLAHMPFAHSAITDQRPFHRHFSASELSPGCPVFLVTV